MRDTIAERDATIVQKEFEINRLREELRIVPYLRGVIATGTKEIAVAKAEGAYNLGELAGMRNHLNMNLGRMDDARRAHEGMMGRLRDSLNLQFPEVTQYQGGERRQRDEVREAIRVVIETGSLTDANGRVYYTRETARQLALVIYAILGRQTDSVEGRDVDIGNMSQFLGGDGRLTGDAFSRYVETLI